jgi:hypothetical protein
LRLGEFRNGYLIPYPDVNLLKLEALGFGDYKCGKFHLHRLDPTQNMERVFGKQPDRIYYVDDKSFFAYCKSYWKDVKVIPLNDIPDPPKKRPKYYVIGTCNKCKREYVMSTETMAEKEIVEKLKVMPFGARDIGSVLPLGECPANGWHTEIGSMWDNMTFDFKNIYREVKINAQRQI